MIPINFITAISIMISFSLLVVFSVWIFYNYKKSDELENTNNLKQCKYCTYVFFNYKEDDILACPRCGSYLQAENNPENLK